MNPYHRGAMMGKMLAVGMAMGISPSELYPPSAHHPVQPPELTPEEIARKEKVQREVMEAARQKRARKLARFTESEAARNAPDRIRLREKTAGEQVPISTPEIYPEN